MTSIPPRDFFLGLDLGQVRDPSAIAVVQRSWLQGKDTPQDPVRFVSYYLCGYLRRWPLGTSYSEIVRAVADLVRQPPLDWPTLAIDATGCGLPVIDSFKAANIQAVIRPILITAGHVTNINDSGCFCVPKVDLVGVTRVILDNRRLQIADVPDSPTA